MSLTIKCSSCGFEQTYEDGSDVNFCPSCGAKISVDGTVFIPSSEVNNLLFSFVSVNPGHRMLYQIDGGTVYALGSGGRISFRVTPGVHTVFISVGRRRYGRTVYVPIDNTALSVDTVYSGRVTHINIIQLGYGVAGSRSGTGKDENIIGAGINYAEPEKAKPVSPLAVISFILSFTVFLSPVAFLGAIIDLIVFSRKKRTGLSIAALIISTFLTLYLFAVILKTK